MTEIWRDIKDYEGLYQVSNLGRVRSVERIVFKIDGRVTHYKECIIKQFKDSHGYLAVHLSKNGISKTYNVHRLVAEAFIPNPDNLPTVDHINRVKTDNRVENLRWADMKLQHNNMVKLCLKPIVQYTLDGQFVAEYPSISEAERQSGINHANINTCCKGKRKSAGGYIWKYKD